MNENKQLTLIQAESDDALFLDTADLEAAKASKRYTAATVEKIELKRNYILDLIATGMPADTISLRVGCSTRTVNLLAAKYAQMIAQNIPQFAGYLRSLAAKAAYYASTKLEGAKLGELAILIGVTSQRAGEMELAAAGVSEESIVNAEEVSSALASARDFVKRLAPPPPVETPKDNNQETKDESNV